MTIETAMPGLVGDLHASESRGRLCARDGTGTNAALVGAAALLTLAYPILRLRRDAPLQTAPVLKAPARAGGSAAPMAKRYSVEEVSAVS